MMVHYILLKDHLTLWVLIAHHYYFQEMDHMKLKIYLQQLEIDGPHLAFAGHTDVVPPGNENSWKHPPFQQSLKVINYMEEGLKI